MHARWHSRNREFVDPLGARRIAAGRVECRSFRAAAKLGALAIPLKLFIIVGLVYLVFTRAHIDGMGFGVGVLTQMAAIIIETGRASLRGAR